MRLKQEAADCWQQLATTASRATHRKGAHPDTRSSTGKPKRSRMYVCHFRIWRYRGCYLRLLFTARRCRECQAGRGDLWIQILEPALGAVSLLTTVSSTCNTFDEI